MKFLLMAAIFAVSAHCMAKSEVVKKIDYDLFFMTDSGKKVPPAEATLGALQGQKFYKCQTVEAKVSDRGSISTANTRKNQD